MKRILFLVLCALAAIKTPRVEGQTALYFPVYSMTGGTNDVTLNIQAANNPTIWNGNFYWLPANGTNLTSTNGLAYISLVPGQYTASILGLPQSWSFFVTNSPNLLNAATLSPSITQFTGVQNLSGTNGVTIQQTIPGNFVIGNTNGGSVPPGLVTNSGTATVTVPALINTGNESVGGVISGNGNAVTNNLSLAALLPQTDVNSNQVPQIVALSAAASATTATTAANVAANGSYNFPLLLGGQNYLEWFTNAFAMILASAGNLGAQYLAIGTGPAGGLTVYNPGAGGNGGITGAVFNATGGGFIGIGSGLTNVNAASVGGTSSTNLQNSQTINLNVANYGAFPNGTIVNDISVTNSILTSPLANFSSPMVGDLIAIHLAGNNSAYFLTAISNVINQTTIGLSNGVINAITNMGYCGYCTAASSLTNIVAIQSAFNAVSNGWGGNIYFPSPLWYAVNRGSNLMAMGSCYMVFTNGWGWQRPTQNNALWTIPPMVLNNPAIYNGVPHVRLFGDSSYWGFFAPSYPSYLQVTPFQSVIFAACLGNDQTGTNWIGNSIIDTRNFQNPDAVSANPVSNTGIPGNDCQVTMENMAIVGSYDSHLCFLNLGGAFEGSGINNAGLIGGDVSDGTNGFEWAIGHYAVGTNSIDLIMPGNYAGNNATVQKSTITGEYYGIAGGQASGSQDYILNCFGAIDCGYSPSVNLNLQDLFVIAYHTIYVPNLKAYANVINGPAIINLGILSESGNSMPSGVSPDILYDQNFKVNGGNGNSLASTIGRITFNNSINSGSAPITWTNWALAGGPSIDELVAGSTIHLYGGNQFYQLLNGTNIVFGNTTQYLTGYVTNYSVIAGGNEIFSVSLRNQYDDSYMILGRQGDSYPGGRSTWQWNNVGSGHSEPGTLELFNLDYNYSMMNWALINSEPATQLGQNEELAWCASPYISSSSYSLQAGLSSPSAGVVQVNNGTNNDLAILDANSYQSKNCNGYNGIITNAWGQVTNWMFYSGGIVTNIITY